MSGGGTLVGPMADAMRNGGRGGAMTAREKVERYYMSDPPQGEKPAEQSVYDKVIDNLDRRIVPEPTRGALRKALDKADGPLTGRAGANEALGRITKR